jgi:hypothetical protein
MGRTSYTAEDMIEDFFSGHPIICRITTLVARKVRAAGSAPAPAAAVLPPHP